MKEQSYFGNTPFRKAYLKKGYNPWRCPSNEAAFIEVDRYIKKDQGYMIFHDPNRDEYYIKFSGINEKYIPGELPGEFKLYYQGELPEYFEEEHCGIKYNVKEEEDDITYESNPMIWGMRQDIKETVRKLEAEEQKRKEEAMKNKPYHMSEHIYGLVREESKYEDSSKYWATLDKNRTFIIIEKKTGKVVYKGESTLKKEKDERVFNESWVSIDKDEHENPIKEFVEDVNIQIDGRKKHIYRRRKGNMTEEEKARVFEKLWIPIDENEHEKPIGEFKEQITLRFKDGKTEMYRRRINHERREREDFERRYSEL